MFAAFRIARAKRECVSRLLPFLAGSPEAVSRSDDFWRDPFVLGFVVGFVGATTEIVTRGKLNTEQRGYVMIGTLQQIGGYRQGQTDLIESFMAEQNAPYKLGIVNAAKLIAFVLERPQSQSDTDLKNASELAKRTSVTGAVSRSQVGDALGQLLFYRVVKERLQGR